MIAVTFAVPALHALRWHVGAMAAGECLAGFFAVWTVHHGGDEHHLFPMVPTCHMPTLAHRIDQANSSFATLQVINLPSAARSLEEGQRAIPLAG